MTFGSKIAQIRKEKRLSRDEIGKMVGTSGAVIGRYERGEITPSVEIAAKIADALEVSLDYLVGSTHSMIRDKKMLYRLELLDQMKEEDRSTILKVLDTYLKEMVHSSAAQKLTA